SPTSRRRSSAPRPPSNSELRCGRRCRSGMRRFWISTAVLAAALAVAPAALGKGASQASITGPGLDKPLVLSGKGDVAQTTLETLAGEMGFFPAVFGQSPDPMLDHRPTGRLGPKYEVNWIMPGPNGTTSTIRQDLYPYARLYPVSYTKPGQRYWGNQHSRGGWFASPAQLRRDLVAVGLPAQAPPSGGGGGTGWLRWVAISVTTAAGLALLAILTTLALRRRPRPEPA